MYCYHFPISFRSFLNGHLYIRVFFVSFIRIVKTLCEHLEEQNIEGFTDAIKDYDSISRLDQWYTTILLRIKKQNNEDPDLR